MDFVTQEDLERRIGADRVTELCDDDNDGVADDEIVSEILGDANREVASILYGKGFARDDLTKLARDRFIRRKAAMIAAQLAGERRTEWCNDRGEGPFHRMGQDGRKAIEKMSSGELRAALEETHGANRSIRGKTKTGCPTFIFNRNPDDPKDVRGRGGY